MIDAGATPAVYLVEVDHMGWISKRAMETGTNLGGGGLSERKKGAPLRKIVGTIRGQDSIFSPAWVVLECGHEGESWGGVRARCPRCRDEACK